MRDYPQAKFIVQKLNEAGFIAYYAGGWVRDFLLKHPSDDLDIATNAPPETIQALFEHTVPIGIAFGIILVVVEGHSYEVATFRKDFEYHDGRRPSKICFTTPVEDAKRRDFTINGMFYDPVSEEVLDYVEGKEDLKKGIIRAIGDPHARIQEDRLRMIRAIRLACRFHFTIEKKTEQAIHAHHQELFPCVAIERIWQEMKKAHQYGVLRKMLIKLHEFSLLSQVFPEVDSLSIKEIEKRLLPIKRYPKEAPLIASFLPLFPNWGMEEREALWKKLKLSRKDLAFLQFFTELENKLSSEEPFCWAHLYASPYATLSLQILASHMEESKGLAFLQAHEENMKLLSFFIERIQKQMPIVQAVHLKELGIQPGPLMGKLLKEAEKIAINEGLIEVEEIVHKLKNSSLWPKKTS